MGQEQPINGYTLEICSNSPGSALAAQNGGAARVELCQNLENGGTTPSPGQIRLTRARLQIGLHVLIRPRSGNFVYSELEFEESMQDIRYCKAEGCDGVVVGMLNPDGHIDVERMRVLVDLARPMKVVFHRAFDLCADAHAALEDAIHLGCDRILTSGMQHTARQGIAQIRSLVEQAKGRIEIMPGSGVDAANIACILQQTGAYSIHSSAKHLQPSVVRHLNSAVGSMNEPVISTSEAQVRQLVEKLQGLKPFRR